MKTARSIKDRGLALLPAGQSFIFFLCCFLYFWLWVNPALHYQIQEPVFFFGSRFLAEFTTWPGGVVEYLSVLLGQFYYYPAAGALVLALICWLAALAMYLLSLTFKPIKTDFCLWIFPAILLLGLSSIYTYNFSFSIGLLITLFLFIFFLKGAATLSAIRWLLFFVLAIVEYYLAGGFVILFLILYIIYIIFHYKNFFDILAGLLVIPIPWITAKYLAYISLHDAWFYHLPEAGISKISGLAWLIWIYVLVFMIIGWLKKRHVPAASEKQQEKYILTTRNKPLSRGLQAGILILVIAGILLLTHNPRIKAYFTTDYLARHNKWQQLIDYQASKNQSSLYEIFETNRALYHSGKLLDKMFTFPQNLGIAGLFLTTQFSELSLLHNSDIAYDLGYYNESLHWAYEALSIKGETGWNLQRLALLHILKGEKSSARRCLLNLQNTILFEKWAEHYLAILDNDSLLRNDTLLKGKFARLINKDFMNYEKSPVTNLINILDADPNNKMAFEYYIAACLLNRQLDRIVKNIPVFRQMGYNRLPIHIQEAIFIYMAQNRISSLEVSEYSLSSRVKTQFSAFQQLMSRFKNKNEAQASMYESFAHTYWYYALYPPVQPGNAVRPQ